MEGRPESLGISGTRLPFFTALSLLVAARSVPDPRNIQDCLKDRVDGLYSRVCDPEGAARLRLEAMRDCKVGFEGAADPENLADFEDNARAAVNALCLEITKAKSAACGQPKEEADENTGLSPTKDRLPSFP